MSNGSASSIVELSRSKARYQDQNLLLKAFIGCDGFTAKEVAVDALNWQREQYANAPKRAYDLQALGYLEQLPGRACRYTNKVAHTYRITDKGMAHLREIGVAVELPKAVVSADQPAVADAASKFSALRNVLG